MTSFLPTAEQIRKLRGNLTARDQDDQCTPWGLSHVDSLLAERFPGYMETLEFRAHTVPGGQYYSGAVVLRVGDTAVDGGRLWALDGDLSKDASRVIELERRAPGKTFKFRQETRAPDLGFMTERWAPTLVDRLEGALAALQAQALDTQTPASSQAGPRIRI